MPPIHSRSAMARDESKTPYVLLVLALAAGAALTLALTWHFTFYQDTFEFLMNRRGFTVDALLKPHNEHIVVLPVAIEQLFLHLFGMTTARPEYVLLTARPGRQRGARLRLREAADRALDGAVRGDPVALPGAGLGSAAVAVRDRFRRLDLLRARDVAGAGAARPGRRCRRLCLARALARLLQPRHPLRGGRRRRRPPAPARGLAPLRLCRRRADRPLRPLVRGLGARSRKPPLAAQRPDLAAFRRRSRRGRFRFPVRPRQRPDQRQRRPGVGADPRCRRGRPPDRAPGSAARRASRRPLAGCRGGRHELVPDRLQLHTGP